MLEPGKRVDFHQGQEVAVEGYSLMALIVLLYMSHEEGRVCGGKLVTHSQVLRGLSLGL